MLLQQFQIAIALLRIQCNVRMMQMAQSARAGMRNMR
jgi:hypothetical protein